MSLPIVMVDPDTLLVESGRLLERARVLRDHPMITLDDAASALLEHAEDLQRCAIYIRHLEALAFPKEPT